MRLLSRSSLASLALLAVVATTIACAGGGAPLPAPSPERLPFAPALDVDFAKMTKTATGLYFRDLEIGAGALVERGQTVSVRYVGSLNNGVEFERTAPGSKPVTFKLGRRQVIEGWDQGIAGMRIGGRRQLVIPPELGYGADRHGSIPPDATLVFVVELVSAKY